MLEALRTAAGCPVLQISHSNKDSTMSYTFSRNTTHPLRASAAVALVFCASLVMPAIFAAAAPPAPTVDITKFAFASKEITIAPGTKITWTNHDETPHTVTSNDKSFASKGLDTADN